MSRTPASGIPTVDPAFDGHLERTLLEMTVEERLDWIWEGMELLRIGREQREREAADPAQRPPTHRTRTGSHRG